MNHGWGKKNAMPGQRFDICSLDQIKEIVGVSGSPFAQRVSDLLLEQLKEGLVTGHVHPEKVVHEIECLEAMGVSKTKPEKDFKGDVLRGFSKKHFFMARDLPKNLVNAFKLESTRSQKLKAVVAQVMKETQDPATSAARIAQRVVEDTHKEKANKGRLTGEWIVFKKHEEKSYYLTLAVHGEGEEKIRDRMVAGCRAQFPFLFE
jgi:hypothetical protein